LKRDKLKILTNVRLFNVIGSWVEEKQQVTKGQRTQQRILSAAKELFLSLGYTATSMRQIAEAVGITPAAIYTHFSGKEELFDILLENAVPVEELFVVFENLESDTPEDCIKYTFHQMVELLSKHDDYMQLALIDAQERSGTSLRKFLPILLPEGIVYFQRLQELDPTSYHLRNLSPFLFIRALISLIGGYIMTEHVVASLRIPHLPDIDWEQGLMDIFLHGVLEPHGEGG
jgi:AcrR family transcriptional regulator